MKYLISNNLLSDNIIFESDMDIETRKVLRPLSYEGVKNSVKLKFDEIECIYSSTYSSCIESAKYLSEKKKIDININSKLDDLKIGETNKTLKTISFFQEKNFDFKNNGGESLNECADRIESFINEEVPENSVVFLPRRALFSYVLKHSAYGYNLDERLVLSIDDEVVMEFVEDDMEIFKVSDDENHEMKLEKVLMENL